MKKSFGASLFVGLSVASSVAATLLGWPAIAHASGSTLAPASGPAPHTLGLELAVAVTPHGSTRWSRITTAGASSVLWLVPARPGAAVDWAADAWLAELENATAPRVVPGATAACPMRVAPERVERWSPVGTTVAARAVTVHATQASILAHAEARGFGVPDDVASKISATYAAGYVFVAVELGAGSGATSSPTIRVNDDANAAVLPLALVGSANADVRITAFVIADQGATVPSAAKLDASVLTWDKSGSDYAEWRDSYLSTRRGGAWLTETVSQTAFFDGATLHDGSAIDPLVARYLRGAAPASAAQCEMTARAAAGTGGIVRRACAPGALVRVAGGTACSTNESTGTIDPSAFACGGATDDLAQAFSGLSPARAVVSRLTGMIPRGELGSDLPLSRANERVGPVYSATPAPCGATPPPPSDPPAWPPTPPHAPAGGSSGVTAPCTTCDTYTTNSGGCGGSTVVEEDTSSSSDDGCSGSSSSSSSGSSDDSSGWDSDDDSSSDDSSSDDSSGWDSDDDSSSDGSSGWDSGDDDSSCDSSSSSDDSCSSDPEMRKSSAGRTKTGKHHAQHKPKRSPVSRYALLFVAALLPLRRRLRIKKL